MSQCSDEEEPTQPLRVPLLIDRKTISPRQCFSLMATGYLTALSRVGLSGQLDYVDRNPSKSGFTPSRCELTASIIHGWAVGRTSENGFEQFVHYYNTQRPHQSLNGQIPVEVLNQIVPLVKFGDVL